MAGLLIEPALSRAIRQWASTPCAPFPCGAEVWDYVCAASDIAAPTLPRHQSRREMAKLLRAKGGLAAYAGELMASIGWCIVGRPTRGDVGVIDLPEMGLTCAVCLDAGARRPAPAALWMVRGSRELVTVRATALIAWRMPCHRP